MVISGVCKNGMDSINGCNYSINDISLVPNGDKVIAPTNKIIEMVNDMNKNEIIGIKNGNVSNNNNNNVIENGNEIFIRIATAFAQIIACTDSNRISKFSVSEALFYSNRYIAGTPVKLRLKETKELIEATLWSCLPLPHPALILSKFEILMFLCFVFSN